jgi:hypothetical protein
MSVDYTKETYEEKPHTNILLNILSSICIMFLLVTKYKIGRGFMALAFFMLYMLIFRNMDFANDRNSLFYLIGAYAVVFISKIVCTLLVGTIHKNDNPQPTNIE